MVLLLARREGEDAPQFAVHQIILIGLLPLEIKTSICKDLPELPVPHQGVLVDLADLGGEHGLHHELVFVLLVGVELEGLETDGNADLGVGVDDSRVRLHTVPTERERERSLSILQPN